jgi:LytS/YehU family sensor histidine kinase
LHRIDEQAIQKAKFKEKYYVNINVDPDTEEASVTKQPRDEPDEIEHSSQKKQRRSVLKEIQIRLNGGKTWKK